MSARWSIAIDPRTPLVAPRKPFIPPSMLEHGDDDNGPSSYQTPAREADGPLSPSLAPRLAGRCPLSSGGGT